MPHSYLNSVGLLLPSIVSSALGMAASAVAVRSECSGCVGGKNSSRVCSCGDIGDGIELNPNAVDLEVYEVDACNRTVPNFWPQCADG